MLNLPVLIDGLADASREPPNTDALSQYLSQYPYSKRLDLLRLLEALVQCCKDLRITSEDDGAANSEDVPTSSQIGEVQSGAKDATVSEDELENSQLLEGVQSEDEAAADSENDLKFSQVLKDEESEDENAANSEEDPKSSQSLKEVQSEVEDTPEREDELEGSQSVEEIQSESKSSPESQDGRGGSQQPAGALSETKNALNSEDKLGGSQSLEEVQTKVENRQKRLANAQSESGDELEDDQRPPAEVPTEVESQAGYELAQTVRSSGVGCVSGLVPRPVTKTTEELDIGQPENHFHFDDYGAEKNHANGEFVNPLSTVNDIAGEGQGTDESGDSFWLAPLSPLSDPTSNQTLTVNETTNKSNASNGLARAVLPGVGLVGATLQTPQDSPSKSTDTTLVDSSVQDSPSNSADTTLVKSSPHDTPTKDRATTPENTTSKANEPSYWELVTQSDIDFATESFEQVKNFGVPGNSTATYKHIFLSLRAGQDSTRPQEKTIYSDGTEWVKLVQASFTDEKKSAIFLALAQTGSCQWHEGQAKLESHMLGVPLKTGKQEVTARFLPDNVGKSARDKHRKNINQHLLRGRRWSQLVDQLGFGILFKHSFELGNVVGESLERLVLSLRDNPTKMFILERLDEQMGMFLSDGQTNPTILEQALTEEQLLDDSLQPLNIADKVGALQELIRNSSPAARLHIRGSTWGFYIDELDRLNEKQWFGEDTIQLCMHLADKLSHMRVGFSVAIHDRHTGKPLHKPFEAVAKRISRWNVAEANDQLVFFFPLFLKSNHFTLLEINQIDRCIYHYDAAGYDTRHVKKPPGPNDGSSCGPLVVVIACRRMMSRPVESLGHLDALDLRAYTFSLIKKAWDSNILIPELSDDRNSEDDIIMSMEPDHIKSLEHSENTSLEDEELSNTMGRENRRKRAAPDVAYEKPKTRSKARRIS
ncbi:hypothetical protein DL764_005958 [Monosporascus ibericus]|uniref:Ubiquitin-like protease family profile domain-containing protein n=1 Tax=Monosporascus ibericus TaxID=155417 RepID=A0A4Q4TAM4_9PEZI|nr:hypothetical protein DL764_005958 [Monosporascus ibericus]